MQLAFCRGCSKPGEDRACADCYNSATPREKHLLWHGRDRKPREEPPAHCLRCDAPAITTFAGWSTNGRGEEIICIWCPRCDPGPTSVSQPYPREPLPTEETDDEHE